MKVKITTQRVSELRKSENPLEVSLYDYIDDLRTVQSSGGLPTAHEKGMIVFPKIDNADCPVSVYKLFTTLDKVIIEDYNFWVYAPNAFLETNVFTGLPNATTFDENDNEVAVKWKDWKADANYDQPLHQNETHCIISCQSFGKYLTEAEVANIISNEESSGIELLGINELNAKLNLFIEEE